MLHGITRNFPTENEEDIFDKKVTILSRFITQRVFHIPEIYCCHDTCKFLYDIAKVTVAVENFPHTQIVNKSDSYDYSQTQS